MAFKTHVDNGKCTGCEECLEACSAKVFEIKAGKAVAVRPDDCVGCESCMEICREDAITVDDTRAALSDTCTALLKDIL